MRLLLALVLVAAPASSVQAQTRDFSEAVDRLAVGSSIPIEFITTYVNITGQPDILDEVTVDGPYPTRFSLSEFWTESGVTRMIVSYVGGPCSNAELLTFGGDGGLRDHLQVGSGCDRDGLDQPHRTFDYRVIGEVIERRHEVEGPDEVRDPQTGTMSYIEEPTLDVWYDYFEVQSDGRLETLSLPDEVDDRRSYGVASRRLLTREELSAMAPTDLRLMRNEIFASNGHIFESVDLREYFGQQPWYRPSGNADDRLTDIEALNVERIVRAEGGSIEIDSGLGEAP
jgi:hypothetical protein